MIKSGGPVFVGLEQSACILSRVRCRRVGIELEWSPNVTGSCDGRRAHVVTGIV